MHSTRSQNWLVVFPAALLLFSLGARAQQNPECTENLCGSPQQNGGGGNGGSGGSILYNYTDDGQTFSYSDDADGDGIPDNFDNCPFVPNRDQKDSDGDGIGDACDNCPFVANRDQKDTNGNGIGDACDPDIDGDGIPNAQDNCPLVPNPDQKITDPSKFTIGDLCNPDIDGDGVPNEVDNCPYVYNPEQNASDPATFEAEGLHCTLDTDGDGIPDTLDNCPLVKNPDQKISFPAKFTIGDACNPDIDGDGVLNDVDNCPYVYNPDQKDSDRDGIGDACDPNFCLVVDETEKDQCLDPNLPFAVSSVITGAAKTGESIALPLFTNRKDTATRYSWTVVAQPDGASGGITNQVGAVTYSSTGFQYYYLNGHEPMFQPDVAGTWRLRLHGELVFDDAVFPGEDAADHDLVVQVAQGASHGCSSFGGDSMMLLGLVSLFAARKRRS